MGTPYSSKSGEVYGILTQMKDTIQNEIDLGTAEKKRTVKRLADTTKAWKEREADLKKNIKEHQERLSENLNQLGELKERREELEATIASKKENLIWLAKNCKQREEN